MKKGVGEAEWEKFCHDLLEAGRLVLDHAPDDPLDQAEGVRYLARLARWSLGRSIELPDPGEPIISWESPKLGGDNPDYLYGGATISGRYEYRLRGHLRDAFRLGIGTYAGSLGSPEGLVCTGYLTDTDLAVDDDGGFEITASCGEQPGTWLPMKPRTNALLIRQTVLDRRAHTPASLEVERAGGAEPDPPRPLDPLAFSERLAEAGPALLETIRQFLDWTDTFLRRPNEIHPVDPRLLSRAQGDPATTYYNGYFELAEGEALVIDLLPPACIYWNLQLTNHWLESLDFLRFGTHVNHHTATVGPDGTVRVIVAGHDPQAANWLDTAGHARGGIAMRFVEAAADVEFRCRRMQLTELNPPARTVSHDV